ncbi:hypothetical protein B0T16DRAFT_113897 [Cercophora newfieldiana]|uniref:Uncharacterized protein n=1 Tax=Cercophora newfieldiana TaxID=92897 RepID=A0AA40CR11_9PEZI|nr:hypothetical protein B0T16DRAFT_113897 [Cercophora newfieldiana]
MLGWSGMGDSGPNEDEESVDMFMRCIARIREAEELVETRCSETYFNGKSRWEAFWRTNLGNRSTEGYPADGSWGGKFKLYLENIEWMGKAYRTGNNGDLIAPKMREQIIAAADDSSEPRSAESTLRTLEQILNLPPELGSVQDFVSHDLLDAGPSRILEELVAITPLAPQDNDDVMKLISPSTSFAGIERSEMRKQIAPAMESLKHACFTTVDDNTVRWLFLLLAFDFSESELNLSARELLLFQNLMAERISLAKDQTLENVDSLLAHTATARDFAVTKRGYMALVPGDTVLGDVVAVVIGGKVPVVLRGDQGGAEEEGRYLLVGEGYLHGFMDGVGMEGGNARRIRIV